MIIFVPPLPELDNTLNALLASGARILEQSIALAEIS
jgi:hypothetical protein